MDAGDRRLIVGDVHGDWQTLKQMLRDLNVIDENGQRQPGWYLVQVGDLIHGGATSRRDEACLTLGLQLFDVLLLGNHELPHAFPNGGFPHFVGQEPLTGPCQRALEQALRDQRYAVATNVDGWVVTHAGVHPDVQRDLRLPPDPDVWAQELNQRFAFRCRHSERNAVFDAVGYRRGGGDFVGGIFWLDWQDLCQAAEQNTLPQIVGHTPRKLQPETCGDKLWCVDVGAALSGKVCAILKEDAQDTWQPIVYDRKGPIIPRVAREDRANPSETTGQT